MMVNLKLSNGGNAMKVQKLVQKLHKACLEHNTEKEKKIWFKILNKSLKNKNTQIVK